MPGFARTNDSAAEARWVAEPGRYRSGVVRMGTLACLLFGHKFIWVGVTEVLREASWEVGGREVVTTKQTDFCVRCGVKRTGAEGER